MSRLSVSQLTSWPPGHAPDAASFVARPFGRSTADLDVDFAQPAQEVVSAVLQLCILSPSRSRVTLDQVWAWTIGERLQALLAVTIATRGPALTGLTRCARSGCAQPIELDLLLTSFAVISPLTSTVWTTGTGERVTARVPTGADLQSWSTIADPSQPIDATAFAQKLIATIDDRTPTADWTFPPAWLDNIERFLAEADPLTALLLPLVCPHCDEPVEVELDLEALLLRRLAQCQTQSLHDIHTLASAYHWSETDIIRLPAWRLAHYRQRLDAEGVR